MKYFSPEHVLVLALLEENPRLADEAGGGAMRLLECATTMQALAADIRQQHLALERRGCAEQSIVDADDLAFMDRVEKVFAGIAADGMGVGKGFGNVD